jgi:hypothetical protein
MFVHPARMAGAEDRRVGCRRGRRWAPLGAVLLLGALLGVVPAEAAAAPPSVGTVIGWGDNDDGEARPPAGLTGVTAIAAGHSHSLALRGDGTVVAWGDNTYGQSSVPAGLTGVTAIAAGWAHSLAVKGDGTVVAWGSNSYGQSSVPAGLTGVTALAGGIWHSLALKSDGTVVAWGRDIDGQASPPGRIERGDRGRRRRPPQPGAEERRHRDRLGERLAGATRHAGRALRGDRHRRRLAAQHGAQERRHRGRLGIRRIRVGLRAGRVDRGDRDSRRQRPQPGAEERRQCHRLGRPIYGQTIAPTGLTGVTAIAAGAYHSLALQGPRYAWSGFLPPVDNPPAVNPVTAGRAIPLTFSLGGDQGLDIFRGGYPASAAYPCGDSTPADAIEPTVTAGASGLSYDPASDRSTYVWKTDQAWAGTCRTLVIRLADGSPARTAIFRFTG